MLRARLALEEPLDDLLYLHARGRDIRLGGGGGKGVARLVARLVAQADLFAVVRGVVGRQAEAQADELLKPEKLEAAGQQQGVQARAVAAGWKATHLLVGVPRLLERKGGFLSSMGGVLGGVLGGHADLGQRRGGT